jgi:tRNA/tmRNA/rRNA uracil-C5-methylase (TrmA/RlmC/RlmD family)
MDEQHAEQVDADGPEVGTELELRVLDIASDGRGVARLDDGRVAFIEDVIDGELVRARVIVVHRKYLDAELVELLEPSIHRSEPPCPIYGPCGGCRYQHIDYPHQLELKTKQVQDALERIGGLEEIDVEPTVACPLPYGYRNKIALHSMGKRHGEQYLGFRARHGRDLLPVEQCLIAEEGINLAVAAVQRQIREAELPGKLPHQVVFRSDGRQAYQDWLIPPPPEAPLPPKTFDVEEPLLPGGRVLVPDTAFYQTNFATHRLLLNVVRSEVEQLGVPGTPIPFLVDAYCGVGVFLLLLADLLGQGVGIESHKGAIRAATATAERAGVANLRFLRGEVDQVLPRVLDELVPAHGPGAGVILVDPPRCGMDPATVAELGRRGLGTILYISCNPSTLARDLKDLVSAGGYRAERVVPFDMFPQTAHCETLALLRRS